ncbi:MAG: 50S ribosomal protein L18, partial [Nitrospinota bacterium]
MATARKVLAREARHRRVRKKIWGSPERPRLCVFRSQKHLYAQLVDDAAGQTLAVASSLSAEVRARARETGGARGSTRAGAELGGALLA